VPRPEQAGKFLLEGLDVGTLHELPARAAVLDDL
jgi:hypothetical protein